MAKTKGSTPLFRYVGLCIDKDTTTHARQITINKYYDLGNEINVFDEDDMRTYTYRLLRFEGTVYNKSVEELVKEREVRTA